MHLVRGHASGQGPDLFHLPLAAAVEPAGVHALTQVAPQQRGVADLADRLVLAKDVH
jgi:hypothetical protein